MRLASARPHLALRFEPSAPMNGMVVRRAVPVFTSALDGDHGLAHREPVGVYVEVAPAEPERLASAHPVWAAITNAVVSRCSAISSRKWQSWSGVQTSMAVSRPGLADR